MNCRHVRRQARESGAGGWREVDRPCEKMRERGDSTAHAAHGRRSVRIPAGRYGLAPLRYGEQLDPARNRRKISVGKRAERCRQGTSPPGHALPNHIISHSAGRLDTSQHAASTSRRRLARRAGRSAAAADAARVSASPLSSVAREQDRARPQQLAAAAARRSAAAAAGRQSHVPDDARPVRCRRHLHLLQTEGQRVRQNRGSPGAASRASMTTAKERLNRFSLSRARLPVQTTIGVSMRVAMVRARMGGLAYISRRHNGRLGVVLRTKSLWGAPQQHRNQQPTKTGNANKQNPKTRSRILAVRSVRTPQIPAQLRPS